MTGGGYDPPAARAQRAGTRMTVANSTAEE
jgi:hypothetical protein